MSGVKGTVRCRICFCQCGVRTVLRWWVSFAFYTCRAEVEGSRWGAGFTGFAVLGCAVLENLGCWYVRQWACKIGYRQHRRRVLENTALNR